MPRLLEIVLPGAPVLHRDESVDAWLDVAASIYSTSAEKVITVLKEAMDVPREDKPPTSFNSELKLCLQQSFPEGSRDCIAYRVELAVESRCAYCPLCFDEKIRHGELPYFKSAWNDATSTLCLLHNTPLFQAQFGTDGQRRLPPWISQRYVKHPAIKPKRKTPLTDIFSTHIRLARLVRAWLESNHANSVAIRQQRLFEDDLRRPPSGTLCRSLLGASENEFRRLFFDLCKLYVAQFESDWTASFAATASQFMGPNWLFSKPPRIRIEKLEALNPLSLIGDPAKRRSVLATVFRTILSFCSDLTCDSRTASIVDAGRSALTSDLDKFSTAARNWALDRSASWPLPAKIGFRKSLRA